jgi:SET domain-containing protein
MRENINFDESPNCAVGKSHIEGQGLFALKKFKKGETVADYSKASKAWEKCQFTNIPKKYKETAWWIGLNKKFALLAKPESSFMRANHSRTPNTNWEPEKMTLTANTAIKPGEEITYDYRKEIAPESVKSNPPPWA